MEPRGDDLPDVLRSAQGGRPTRVASVGGPCRPTSRKNGENSKHRTHSSGVSSQAEPHSCRMGDQTQAGPTNNRDLGKRAELAWFLHCLLALSAQTRAATPYTPHAAAPPSTGGGALAAASATTAASPARASTSSTRDSSAWAATPRTLRQPSTTRADHAKYSRTRSADQPTGGPPHKSVRLWSLSASLTALAASDAAGACATWAAFRAALGSVLSSVTSATMPAARSGQEHRAKREPRGTAETRADRAVNDEWGRAGAVRHRSGGTEPSAHTH